MKNHHHNGPVPPQPNSREQIHADLSARAYELWARRGRPEGQSDAIWLEAEQEFVAERTSADLPAKKS